MIESQPLTVTLDTGVLDDRFEEIEQAASRLPSGVDFATVGLAQHERGEHPSVPDLPAIRETAVIGEWRLGFAVLGSDGQAAIFEDIKKIIGGGSIQPLDDDEYLGSGTQHQVRDATIFEAHVREGRDVFITNDERHFIRNEKREKLEALCGTRIMTPDDFIEWCAERSPA